MTPKAVNDQRAQLAKLLADIAPGDLNKSFLVTGGGVAHKNALNMAGPVTERQKLISRFRSYHGGTYGAIHMEDTGEFVLGSGNTIGGSGQENSWPLTIGAGAYASAGSLIPTSGNTNDDIRVHGGYSAKSGAWRKFTDLDYIVSSTPTL